MNKTEIPHKCNRCGAILWFNECERNYIYDNKTNSYRCKGCFQLFGIK